MKKTARKAGRFLLFYNSLRVKELMSRRLFEIASGLRP